MTSIQPIEPSTTLIPEKNTTRTYAIGIVTAIVVAALPFVVGATGGNYWVRVLDFAMLYVMLALGLNVVVGFAGLLDLGYIAFYAVGAYTAALLTSPHLTSQFAWIASMFPGGLHTPYWIVIPCAMAFAAIAGILLGAPTLRLRGDYLAIVTLGFGEIVRIFMNNLDRPVNITNGPQGITGVAPLHVFGFNLAQPHEFLGFTFTSVYMYYYAFVICALLVIWVCTRLQHSRIGRAWAAIREDEIAAKAMGINTRNVKLLAFAMGASFGGLSGAMFGAFQGFVSPESFTFWESVVVLACVVLGGMGHIPGVILGAVLLAIFPEFLRSTMGPLQHMLFGHEIVDTEVIRQLLYGLAMVVIMLYRSEGLWPSPKHEDKIAKIAKRGSKKPVRA
ncbi:MULTISPECIES: ABC transporter permease subunit [Paraburkholderia]|uniref:Amino acid/amide ABC transporter membrane protein 2, HAAT family n=1 Tax=Paraburkholderia tropica TaxID=92647 RepID=A0A1A5XKD8_9BURK|nr:MULTISPECIES: ABC transporter ATP-binding protein [Paraburkholderia]MBB2979229.1 branched-chain amino acid transport system permease protein [Paraburkholderia tropica]MBB3001980.1 branched-chain amino acid transport system permease protein [Paraburkholderia tropica]MBB6321364.1 branched-chain amino acid transport system permease protein [Paraburkholderia tropica]OBR53620.1 ABC transporter ATP-binding protein [Paraburkholderia tropica]QNB12066.1 ABC transporter ATP-binding protein [Paraburkh